MFEELDQLERGWDHAAQQDAFFNILTIHGLTEQQFWQMGRDEITELVEHLSGRGCQIGSGRALDFGCGIGRLTQALSQYFDWVDGIDISNEMIRLARQHNTREGVCFYHNPAANLNLYDSGTFDLVYSTIVLQHMPSDLACCYVREFLRVTKRDGYVVFQIPEGFDQAKHGSEWLSMYGTDRSVVESWLADATLVDVQASAASGAGFASHRYTVRT